MLTVVVMKLARFTYSQSVSIPATGKVIWHLSIDCQLTCQYEELELANVL